MSWRREETLKTAREQRKAEYNSRMDAAIETLTLYNRCRNPETKRVAEHIYQFAEQLRRAQ